MASPIGADGVVPSPAEIVVRVGRVFGASLLGAYLYGSATLGGLRKHSDIDVLAVLGRATSEHERRALVALMLEISGSRASLGPGRPVELTLVVQAHVRPWRYPPRSEFQYGEWLRADYEQGMVPMPSESADLATLLFQVLASGQPLFGPPPPALLDPVPPADLRRAIGESLPALLVDLETDRNVVLTLARMWLTMETGRIAPKDVAADWALERLPVDLRGPLEQARAVYLDEAPDRVPDSAALHGLADHVVSHVRGAGDEADAGLSNEMWEPSTAGR